MPDIESATLDAARAFGASILENRRDVSGFKFFGNTSRHMVFKAASDKGRMLCLKVSLRCFGADLKGETPPSDHTELNAFAVAGSEATWMPRLIDQCPDARWLLREWVGEDTSNRIKKSEWTKQRLDDFWMLFADAFEVFHAAPEPYLIRDIKPTNVSYDAHRFYMFDFNTVKRLDHIRKWRITSRLGNQSNRYAPPELLLGDFSGLALNADFFGFATVFQRYATGLSESVWSNGKRNVDEAMATYQSEYNALKVSSAAAMTRLGYSSAEIAFVIACLNPSAEQRPNVFLRPN